MLWFESKMWFYFEDCGALTESAWLVEADGLTDLRILDNLPQSCEGLGLSMTEFLACGCANNLRSTFTGREWRVIYDLSFTQIA